MPRGAAGGFMRTTGMSNVDQKLQAAESRISVQNSRIARAEVEKEQAQETLERVRAALKEEFDVETGADVKRVRDELEASLTKEVAKIESELEAAGA